MKRMVFCVAGSHEFRDAIHVLVVEVIAGQSMECVRSGFCGARHLDRTGATVL